MSLILYDLLSVVIQRSWKSNLSPEQQYNPGSCIPLTGAIPMKIVNYFPWIF